MRRLRKTIWQGVTTACTSCKRACTQRETRLGSKGDTYPEKLMGPNESASRLSASGPLKGQGAAL